MSSHPTVATDSGPLTTNNWNEWRTSSVEAHLVLQCYSG
jgi:hypothetical protein